MQIFTVTCDHRPAAMVRAIDKSDAIATALDLAEQRNLLGLIAGPRRFEARGPTDAEMIAWFRHQIDHLILEEPTAA